MRKTLTYFSPKQKNTINSKIQFTIVNYSYLSTIVFFHST